VGCRQSAGKAGSAVGKRLRRWRRMLPRVNKQSTKDESRMASASRVPKVQHSRDEAILHRLCNFFGCGRVVLNRGTQTELRIRRLNDLKRVVQFFSETQLQSKKRRDFEIFRDIIDNMAKRQHLEREGLTRIATMPWQMNRKVKPRYLESSETLRRKSRKRD